MLRSLLIHLFYKKSWHLQEQIIRLVLFTLYYRHLMSHLVITVTLYHKSHFISEAFCSFSSCIGHRRWPECHNLGCIFFYTTLVHLILKNSVDFTSVCIFSDESPCLHTASSEHLEKWRKYKLKYSLLELVVNTRKQIITVCFKCTAHWNFDVLPWLRAMEHGGKASLYQFYIVYPILDVSVKFRQESTKSTV